MKQKFPKIWVLGASFETLNMGVNALAESSIKCIFTHWPHANITLRTPEHITTPLTFTFNGQKFTVTKRNIGLRRNLFKTQNVYTLLGYALLLKIIPSLWLKNKLKAHNPYFKEIMETDLVFDITAGDSFSDIYGMRIFGRTSLVKWLFILCDNKFIMLPQTYGPFRNHISKMGARYILIRTTAIYTRDMAGIKCVKEILGKVANKKIIRFIPDVTFVLTPEKPKSAIIEQLTNLKIQGHILVGLNVSGLLYNNSDLAKNQFGLKSDYRKLEVEIIKWFMTHPNIIIVLVPHVYAKSVLNENDIDACYALYQQMIEKYPNRILRVEDQLDHKQIKYLIGLSDFFMGARMHSCIAAISQCIPTVGIAYSHKFIGAFSSVGINNSVADLRTKTETQILAQIQEAFNSRDEMAKKLRVTVPKVKEKVLGLFDEIEL
jgi:polysaccharide pyruvyl transferase WcaK-like protein